MALFSKLNLGRKPDTAPATDPPPSAPEAAALKLVVERLEALVVSGWSASPSGDIGTVHLARRGHALDVTAERTERRDVAVALGLPDSGLYGYALPLPHELVVNGELDLAGLTVQAGSTSQPLPPARPLRDLLEEWAGQLQAAADGEMRESQWVRFVGFLARAGGPAVLSAGRAAWAADFASARDCLAALSDPSVAPRGMPALKFSVETLQGLTLRGWACAAGQRAESFTLKCNGHPVDCGVVRVEREDVRAALAIERLDVGFELELPGLIWQQADTQGQCRIELEINGAGALAEPLNLNLEGLQAWLEKLESLLRSTGSEVTPTEAAELQYQILLALEHVQASGQVGRLSGAASALVAKQAARFSLAKLFAAAGSLPQETAAAEGGTPVYDYATILTWRLLRRFNTAMGEPQADPGSCLETLLNGENVKGEARARLVAALIPYFCGRGAYGSIRPWVDLGRLRQYARSRSRWEASLLLPELMASGDTAAASALLLHIEKLTEGWLNTECIGESARLFAASIPPARLERAEVEQFARRLLSFIDSMGGDYWSRSHDRHLVGSVVSLLSWAPREAPGMTGAVVARALRHYGLIPEFWNQVESALPEVQDWPAELRRARTVFGEIRQRLTRPDSVQLDELGPLSELVSYFRSKGNAEADALLREIMLTAFSTLPHGSEALALGPLGLLAAIDGADTLRLAAHPVAGSSEVAGCWPALDEQIRQLTEVPRFGAFAQLVRFGRVLASEQVVAGPGTAPLVRQAELDVCLRALLQPQAHFLGVRLAAVLWAVVRKHGSAGEFRLAALRQQFMEALDASLGKPQPPAAVTSALSRLLLEQRHDPDEGLGMLCNEVARRLRDTYGRLAVQTPPGPSGCLLNGQLGLHSTLVVIYSCRKNLETRIPLIRSTWVADLKAAGVPYVILVGDGQGELDGDVLSLPCSDAYEALPAKTLAMVRWVHEKTDFDYLLKIDDDCHLAVDRFFEAPIYQAHHYWGRRLHRAEGGTDRIWHQGKSSTPRAAVALDKSPEPSLYADGGAGYTLSRYAMAKLLASLAQSSGARLTRSAYMEDKLLGDLLALGNVSLSNEGHESLVRRRFGDAASPVNAYQNTFYPGRSSPTLISHLDDARALPAVAAATTRHALRPARLWPSYAAPVLGGSGTNQLELLSPESGAAALSQAEVLVVAVARNERVLMPHFLAHYRKLGVRHFVLVDNLSDDGTREYLLTQDDVVLYSADTEYRHSHFGVSWQQAVLAAHGLGRWVVLADIDEFLVYPGCEDTPLPAWLASLQQAGHDAALTLMVDMYPPGALDTADMALTPPFEAAPCFDRVPLVQWHLGSGCFSNGPTYLSALRHRLIANSAPNLYTSQKLAVFRYQPWVRLSEGLHYASNLNPSPQHAWFAHFKYHQGFKRKVIEEVNRKQHFNGAEEYKKYLDLIAEASKPMNTPETSTRYASSRSFQGI